MRPGCTGTIEDGYCSECGLAPLAGAPGATPQASSSGALPSTISTTAGVSGRTPSTRSTRSARSGAVRSSRRLGGGHIVLSPLPARDPLATLVPGVVPERKRFCSQCGAKLTRDRGFCAKCGQEYSFIPTLQPGDVVLGKYAIKGTMAFGGLGWIYLRASPRRSSPCSSRCWRGWGCNHGCANTMPERDVTASRRHRR